MQKNSVLVILGIAILLLASWWYAAQQDSRLDRTNTPTPSPRATLFASPSPSGSAQASASPTPSPIPSPSPTPTPVNAALNLVAGKFKPDSLTINQGDLVNLTITTDVDGVLHLHGYELEQNVVKTSTLSFRADKAGRFTLELHPFGKTEEEFAANLIVNPQ